MNKTTWIFTVAFLLASAVAFSSITINKKHRKLKGKDDITVNCNYCHKKAQLPKKKSDDLKKAQAGEFCNREGCHK